MLCSLLASTQLIKARQAVNQLHWFFTPGMCSHPTLSCAGGTLELGGLGALQVGWLLCKQEML